MRHVITVHRGSDFDNHGTIRHVREMRIFGRIVVNRPIPGLEFCLLETSLELRSSAADMIDELVFFEPVLSPFVFE